MNDFERPSKLPRLDVGKRGGLTSWHPGVLEVQNAMGFASAVRNAYEATDDTMPPQHRDFHTHKLHFMPLCILDNDERPWVSFLAPRDAQPDSGWVSSPGHRELLIRCDVTAGDPLLDHTYDAEPFLVAGLGVELSTRRRNKFAGEAVAILDESDRVAIHVRTDQVLGNCPKYHNTRHFRRVDANPNLVSASIRIKEDEHLPSSVVEAIKATDICFLGTFFRADGSDPDWQTSHLGLNHRGGPNGFMRVRSDGRTIVLPDYSGNRMMTSLGNIESTHVAAVTIPNFQDGSILYLSGNANNLFGEAASKIMPRTVALTTIQVTSYRYVLDALPIRSDIQEFSPYDPIVRFLAEEKQDETTSLRDTSLLLAGIRIHAPDLATFTFRTSQQVTIKPGQYAVIDTTPLFGVKKYAHMAMPGYERTLNDDGIRTWTISASNERSISLTIREKPGGRITGTLMALARGLQAEEDGHLLTDTSRLGIRFDLVGVGGAFALAKESLSADGRLRALYCAAGIGITPLLALLPTLETNVDLLVIWSTRDPIDVALDLIENALPKHQQLRLAVHLYVTSQRTTSTRSWPFEVKVQAGRFRPEDLTTLDIADRQCLLCGTPSFETMAIAALVKAGAKAEAIKRESFAF